MSPQQDNTYVHTIQAGLGSTVRIAGDHDRIYLIVRVAGSRIPLTIPIELDPADDLFARGREIVAVQRADIDQRERA